MAWDYRIGQGIDVHRFRRGRKLVLGGVVIPHDRGLSGHSDADVLLHALINAVLGAMGSGDIGMRFPDTDPRTEGISSVKLLQRVLRSMRRRGFRLVNGDITLLAEKPKLAPHYAAIRKSVAGLFNVPQNRINIKAGTTEKMGWVGQEKGIAAFAVVLLRKQ